MKEERTKPGWKTSELWLGIAAVALSTLIATGGLPVGGVWERCFVIVAAILAHLGYAGSRAVVKREASRAQSIKGGKR